MLCGWTDDVNDNIHVYISIILYTFLNVFMCVCMHVCVCLCVHMCVRKNTLISKNKHTCRHVLKTC